MIKQLKSFPARNRSFFVKGAGTIGVVTALLLGAALPAAAQQTEIEALRAQLAELSARLEKLEAEQKAQQTKAAEAAKSGPAVTTREKVTVSGLLQVHGLGFLGQDNAFPRRADTIRLRRGEMRITAPSITSRVSGTMQFDFAKAISGSTNIAAGQNLNVRARDNVLQEIQISYLLNKRGNDSHFVDVGQYKIPIGYESLVSSAALQTVERGLFFTQRDPAGSDSGYGDVRDSGIQLRGTFNELGNFGALDYRVGIFNGLGDRQNTTAVTDNKAVLGWLALRPKAIDGLQIGVSGGGGNTALGAGNNRFSRGLFNLFGVYKKDKITFQSEYLKGRSQLRGGVASSDVSGYYASLGYLFTPKIEGVLRYDTFDSNRRVANAEAKDITLGVNYYIKGNNAKIQANLVRRNGAPGSPVADLRPDRTEIRTNFQVGF